MDHINEIIAAELSKGSNITMNDFFDEIIEWRDQSEENLIGYSEALKLVHSKPVGAVHSHRLQMAEDGTIWEFSLRKERWYELVRGSSRPFAEYKRKGWFSRGKKSEDIKFIKCAGDNAEEDWGWEIKNSDYWSGPYPEAERYEILAKDAESGLRVAKTLLNKREQVANWIQLRAKNQGEARASINYDDWDDLVVHFAQGMDSSGTDSLSCSLSILLDQLALGRQVRFYMS